MVRGPLIRCQDKMKDRAAPVKFDLPKALRLRLYTDASFASLMAAILCASELVVWRRIRYRTRISQGRSGRAMTSYLRPALVSEKLP